MSATVFANGMPNEQGVFLGLAQAPLHFHNAIAELVDNGIAAKPEKFNILVDISDTSESGVLEVSVVDDCLGISLNPLRDSVFRVGSLPPRGSSHLREHGFGLKNVLAKVEAFKGSWRVFTRDRQSFDHGVFYSVKGPLRYQLPITSALSSEWHPHGSTGPGTIVEFRVPLGYLQTVTRGTRGRPPTTIGRTIEFLREHLGVFYRGYLEGKRPIGAISTSINWGTAEEVEPIKPDYKTRNRISRFIVRTNRGIVHVEGEHGELEPNSPATRNRVYYYRNSAEAQGVDFRIGKRVVATRLITEIWQRPRHPTLNPFCGEFSIDAIPDHMPKTLNNKTAIDFDDEIWTDIADAIRRKVDLPKWKGARTESELREELARQLEAHKRPNDVVSQNYDCFRGAGVVIDIYLDESHRSGEIIIYETKAGKVAPLDVYQLRMYWDGIVEDGKQPSGGILVGKESSTGAQTVIAYLNSLSDKNGKRYRLEFKKWADFGISPL